MGRFYIFILIHCCAHLPVLSQNNYNYRSPVDYTFLISGGFAELRETHFHAGIDIKPSGNGADKIFAIGEGYISRIRVSSGGYGLVVYINHPSTGHTSVYAHLERFNPQIEALILDEQYRNETYEVDIHLPIGKWLIKKGDYIGLMGNSGYSFGKHLHFEVRDTHTEKPIHPCNLGFVVKDDVKPTVLHLSVRGLDADMNVVDEVIKEIGETTNQKMTIENTIEIKGYRAGIAIETFDRTSHSHNKIGLYSLEMYLDGQLHYFYKFDILPYDQTGQISGFYDYGIRKFKQRTYSLCYRYPELHLDFLRHENNGIIDLPDLAERKVKLILKDYSSNTKIINFTIKRSNKAISNIHKNYRQKIMTDESLNVSENHLRLNAESGTFYRNIYFKLNTLKSDTEDIYEIHEASEPLKKSLKIGIQPAHLLQKYRSKAIIVHHNTKQNEWTNWGGEWEEDYLVISSKIMGQFKIAYDTIGPTIKALQFSKNSGKLSSYRFEVNDNFKTQGSSVKPLKIKVWIDGRFIITPYTNRTSVLEIPINNISRGHHSLKIVAIDHSGNTSIFEQDFVKS